MTNNFLKVGIFLLAGFISCEKENTVTYLETNTKSDYCINYIRNTPDSILLPDEDLNIARSLFDVNKLDYIRLQFYRLQTDELGSYHVRCFQFVNGLKIFTEDLIFHFRQTKKYATLSGDLIEKIVLNTEPSMNPDDVIEKYLAELNQDNSYNGNKEDIRQGCFDIEFGYYDLNAGISYAENNFTKAWKVNPKGKEYPFAYINDMTSNTIYYDNGIRY